MKNNKQTIKNYVKSDIDSSIKKEIEELEKKKENTGKGIRGVLKKLALNKQISDKRGYITAKDKIRSTNKRIELINVQTKLANAQANLNEAKKKTQIDFGEITSPSKKQLNIEDVFK